MRIVPTAGAAAAFALALLCVRPVLAGDAAEISVLGFSPDGGIFAFEEFGVQDGSGFPYANRFYIDTAHDGFLPGTPVRVTLQDESATVADARAKARQNGQAIVGDAVLAANPGFAAGRNAVTELSADPSRMAVNPRPVFPPLDAPLEFRVEEVAVAQPQRCQDLGEIRGFRLLRVGTTAGAQTAMVHEDDNIPASRGCPLGYAIGGVQTFYPAGGDPVFAVLVSVRQVGFEGPDHRWIAVTGRFGD
jgi:predicted secreted protein